MKLAGKKVSYKKIAVALSLCVLVVWVVLGTSASIAWFQDTATEVTNIFHFADFKLDVSYRLTDGKWEEVDSQTELFDREARYEPGYVQIVYLKVKNNGASPFQFYTAVNVNGCIVATNSFGQQFALQDYLKFGLTISNDEQSMKDSVPDRETAVALANMPLHNYSTEVAVLEPGEEKYFALIVRMPEEVGNIANYRGTPEPMVELGVTVKADQLAD